MGKGDDRRPAVISDQRLRLNWARTFGGDEDMAVPEGMLSTHTPDEQYNATDVEDLAPDEVREDATGYAVVEGAEADDGVDRAEQRG
jgi:hypothetical protein